jgi:hypothetical protein
VHVVNCHIVIKLLNLLFEFVFLMFSVDNHVIKSLNLLFSFRFLKSSVDNHCIKQEKITF